MKRIAAVLIVMMISVGALPIDVFAGTSSTVTVSAAWIDTSIENDAETGCGYIEWMRFTAPFGDKIVRFTDSDSHEMRSGIGNRVSGTIYFKIVGGSTGITYAEWTRVVSGDNSGDYSINYLPTINCNDTYLSVYCKQNLTYNNGGTCYCLLSAGGGGSYWDGFTLYLVDQYLSDSSYYAQQAAANAITAASNATSALNAANTANTNATNALNAVSNASGNTVTAVRDAGGTVLLEARQAKNNAENASNYASQASTNSLNAYNTAQTINTKVDSLENAVNHINTSIIGVNDDNTLIVSAVREPDGTVLAYSKGAKGAVEDTNGNTITAVRDSTGTVLDASRSANEKMDLLQTALTSYISSDTDPPEIKITTVSGARATSGNHISAVLDVSDNAGTVFAYSLDSITFHPLPVNGQINLPIAGPGSNLITVWVKDEAGNVGRCSIVIRKL